MATPTNFQPMPLSKACHNGVVTFGAPVAQMALALKQLNQVKFRSAGFYHIGRSTWLDYLALGYMRGAYNRGYNTAPIKGQTDEFDLFYFSAPTSQWVGIEFMYGMSSLNSNDLNGPSVLFELYRVSGGSIGTKIDEGCEFLYPNQLQAPERATTTGVNRANTGSRLYTFPSGGISAPTTPRPLYIPPANRGEELIVKVTASEVALYAVHLFDIFMEA